MKKMSPVTKKMSPVTKKMTQFTKKMTQFIKKVKAFTKIGGGGYLGGGTPLPEGVEGTFLMFNDYNYG